MNSPWVCKRKKDTGQITASTLERKKGGYRVSTYQSRHSPMKTAMVIEPQRKTWAVIDKLLSLRMDKSEIWKLQEYPVTERSSYFYEFHHQKLDQILIASIREKYQQEGKISHFEVKDNTQFLVWPDPGEKHSRVVK